MYRSLNIECLGITGRQSELIELALTYKFKGFDLDMEAFARTAEKRGMEHATRCIASAQKSAELKIGAWELPVRWQGDDATFKADLQNLPAMANVAKAIEATRCVTTVMPGHESLTLKDNFEFHTARFKDIADLLGPHGISLGLSFLAPAAAREGLDHQFIVDAESMLSLIDMVSADNVGLHLDTWNWHLGNGTMEQLEKLGAAKVVAVRASDLPEGASVESIQLKQRMMPKLEGIVPNADILNKLHDLGYAGPVAPFPHVSQYQGVTRDRMVQTVSEAIRSVWPGAELAQEAEAEAAEAQASGQSGGGPAAGAPAVAEAKPTPNGQVETAKAE